MGSQQHTKVKKKIIIKGARVHNLKNIGLTIPHNKLIVITGVSGSGKSSLAYDTIYAEGQRRYVESLSSYARQFVGMMNKPDADYIHGIAPAVAIEQSRHGRTRSSRSTVGTSTEIYDYLKILFARIGKTFSPVSGKEVKKHTVSDVMQYIHSLPDETRVMLLAPIQAEINLTEQLQKLLKQGFSRVEINDEIKKIEAIIENENAEDRRRIQKNKNTGLRNFVRSQKLRKEKLQTFFLVIDRFTVEKGNKENDSRIADSVQTTFYEGQGELQVKSEEPEAGSKKTFQIFSTRFESDGIAFEEPGVHLFSFNNPIGACKTCNGFGSVIGFDENLIVPNKNLSVYEEAIACWRGEKMSQWKNELIVNAHKFDFPVHRPYYQLTQKEKKLLWTGNEYFHGLNDFFRYIEAESYKIQYRVMLARYRGKTICNECNGSRIRKEADYVKIAGKSIGDITSMQVKDSLHFFKNISLENQEKQIAKRLLTEITSRLQFLNDVGLAYLTLNRLSNTLSGGESQRINLATSLGSSLVGSMYILDEPSIGLHSRDTGRLIKVLKSLRDIGNTVIVVEHDEEIIRAADEIIDLGPDAGIHGGEIVFQGQPEEIKNQKLKIKSYTVSYLNGEEKIDLPERRRRWKNYIEVVGARENNLKSINVKFPLNVFTVVTGVSGSGKTSLIKNVLYAGLKRFISGDMEQEPVIDNFKLRNSSPELIKGDLNKISSVEIIDQNSIGKSSRSNPITYIKGYDDIRDLFASQPLAKMRGYKPSVFSFNVDGGRCEVCEGEGEVTIEMQFMADVHITCEACKGKRFKDDVLEIKYNEKNIADILDMTVDEAIGFFSPLPIHSIKGNEDLGADAEKKYASSRCSSGQAHNHQTSSRLGAGASERIKYELWNTQRFISNIAAKLKLLHEVGMGYIKLGQSSGTLSGGESQRVKLATFLAHSQPFLKGRENNTESPSLKEGFSTGFGSFFIFDEPTTGLHFHDIKKLLRTLNRMVDEGHTIIVIEHNSEIIKCADHVIDLGPEGGDEGGYVVFEGTPEELAKCEKSITGKFLNSHLRGAL